MWVMYSPQLQLVSLMIGTTCVDEMNVVEYQRHFGELAVIELQRSRRRRLKATR